MYTRRGLGEILPNSVRYSDQDSPAAGQVALIRQGWDLYKSGVQVGGNWDDFQEVVKLGWVPDTPDGYDRFMWYRVNRHEALRRGLPEFVGWLFAYEYAKEVFSGVRDPTRWAAQGWPATTAEEAAAFGATLVRKAVPQYVSQGYTSQAQADVLVAAFDRYYAHYLSDPVLSRSFGGPATSVTTAPVGTAVPVAPQPDPAYPVGLRLLVGGQGSATFSYPVYPIQAVLGFHRVTVYDGLLPEGGNVRVSPWEPTPRTWVVRTSATGFPADDLKRGWWGAWPARGVPWADAAFAAVDWNAADKPMAVLRDEAELRAWLMTLGLPIPIPASWAEPIRDVGAPTLLVPQPGSPEVPEGSEIRVPLPGDDLVFIKQPGKTTFTLLPAAPVSRGGPVRGGGDGGLVMSEGFPATASPTGAGIGGLGWLAVLGAGWLLLRGRKSA